MIYTIGNEKVYTEARSDALLSKVQFMKLGPRPPADEDTEPYPGGIAFLDIDSAIAEASKYKGFSVYVLNGTEDDTYYAEGCRNRSISKDLEILEIDLSYKDFMPM